MKRRKSRGRRGRKKRKKSRKKSTRSSRPRRAQRKRRKESEPSILTLLGGVALGVVEGTGGFIKSISEQHERDSSAYMDRSELKSLIAKEGHRRGLEGEPPEYVVKRAMEGEVDTEKVIDKAVDYWEETEAYRRVMD